MNSWLSLTISVRVKFCNISVHNASFTLYSILYAWHFSFSLDADEDIPLDASTAEADPEGSQSSSENGGEDDDAEGMHILLRIRAWIYSYVLGK
jgi:hypothetical protein